MAPEADAAELSARHACLLGLALTLHRAPRLARTPDFAETVRARLQAPPPLLLRPRRAVTRTEAEDRAPSRAEDMGNLAETTPTVEEPAAVPGAPSFTPAVRPEPPDDVAARIEEQLRRAPLAHRTPTAGVGVRPPLPPAAEIPVPLPLPVPDPPRSPVAQPPAGTRSESHPPRAVPEWVDTDFGGLFYLVNVGLFLGLYGDFTTPRQPGLALPIWDFVALVGGELLGDQGQDDPVWALLARLAGRADDEEPGRDFEPSDNDGATLEGWLARLMPRVRTRLLLALAPDDPADLPRLVCRHRARVFVTATRVDVVLSLAELPIAIRLAGLDRDPGWVPAAGRGVYFHFE